MDCSRRVFLKATAGAAAAAGGWTRLGNVPVTAGPADASTRAGNSQPPRAEARERLQASLQALRAGTGLKIQSVETFTRGTTLSVVRVRADDGSEGWGQISTYDADIAAEVMHRKIARHALGRDPAELDAIVRRCIEANYKFPWSFVCRALSGLDTAIWDLRGRLQEKGVCQLLGARPRPIPVYGSSMSRSIRPADEARRLVRLRESQGFRAFKVRVGKVCGHDQDQWPGRTEALIPAVRKALGRRVSLLVDGNSCYSPPKAIQVGRLLEDYDYCHFEEPCPYWELEWTAEVAKALQIPVAGGEQDNDLAQWRRMVRMRAVDIVQPDILYVGGLTRALRVAAMADGAGLPCVPHSANLAMVTVFALHMMAAIPNAGDYVEWTIEKNDWATDLYRPMPEVRDGKVAVPDGPGWGVSINPAWLEKAQRRVSESG